MSINISEILLPKYFYIHAYRLPTVIHISVSSTYVVSRYID